MSTTQTNTRDTAGTSAPSATFLAVARWPGRHVFGITLDQMDTLGGLIRCVTAHGDVIAVGGAGALDRESIPALGEAIYTAGREARRLLDAIGEQPLPGTGATSSEVPLLDRPTFARELHGRLQQASEMVQMLRTAAARADRKAEVTAACEAVAEVLGAAIEALEAKFETG